MRLKVKINVEKRKKKGLRVIFFFLLKIGIHVKFLKMLIIFIGIEIENVIYY